MFQQFYRSAGAKEFLCMISIAEILHIGNMIWLPLRVRHQQADFSSAIFLFGSMLIMMKYTSNIQQSIKTIAQVAYMIIIFALGLLMMLTLWSTLNIWLSTIIPSEVTHYFGRLILSITLVYYALIDWIPIVNLPPRNNDAWKVLKQNASKLSLGIKRSSNEIIDRIWRKYNPVQNAPQHMRRKRTTK